MPDLQNRPNIRPIPDKPRRIASHTILKTLCIIPLLCLLTPAQSQTIYKIIDAEGNISYSSIKPDDASEVHIIEAPREPSQEEINAAQQRQAELMQSRQRIRARKKTDDLDRSKQRKKDKKTLQQTIDNNNAIPGLLI
jgi:hypothetical protein